MVVLAFSPRPGCLPIYQLVHLRTATTTVIKLLPRSWVDPLLFLVAILWIQSISILS